MKKYKIVSRHKVGRVEKIVWFILSIVIGVIFSIIFFYQDAANYLRDIPRNDSKRIRASFMLWFIILFFWFLDYFPELEKKFRPQIRIFYE